MNRTPSSPLGDIPIQHVDIDNFDESPEHHAPGCGPIETTRDKDERPAHSYKVIVLVISIVVIGFVLVSLIIMELVVPSSDEVIYNDDDAYTTDCILAYQETTLYLEQLQGMAWIEFTLASAAIGTIVYHLFEVFQDKIFLPRGQSSRFVVGDCLLVQSHIGGHRSVMVLGRGGHFALDRNQSVARTHGSSQRRMRGYRLG